jgi:HEAT repeat protein
VKSHSAFAGVLFFFIFIQVPCVAEDTEVSRNIDTIKYGLENEITDLVSSLQQKTDRTYDVQLQDLFANTKSDPIRESILSLFSSEKNTALKDFALTVLKDPYDYKQSMDLATLSYAGEIKLVEASPLIRKILDGDKTNLRERAIDTLGKIGNPEDAVYLLNYLDSDFSGDQKQRLIIRQNVMSALGEFKDVAIQDRLIKIAKDTEEDVMIRASAVTALGKLALSESIPVLTALYQSDDPALRTAVVGALSSYNTPEAIAVILEAFRDNYYKVRLQAVSAAEKQKVVQAIPYLLYRAKNDPAQDVKEQSFDALGALNQNESNTWLASLVKDDKTADDARVKAATVLVKNNFDFIFPDIEKVMLQSLADDKKTWLRYQLGKLIAGTSSPRTEKIAAAYLSHQDTITRSLGMDMYAKNKYPALKTAIEKIAGDKNQGALQRRAKKMLE